MEDHEIEPAVTFKRRKTTHTKRARLETEDKPAAAPATAQDNAIQVVPTPAPAEDGDSVTLKEIMRNRKRPRDRLREAAARAELTKAQAIVLREQDAPKQGMPSRFVPQTGQIVDKDDHQITEYIEARRAEKNHRLYGWPIPPHLAAIVAALSSESSPLTAVSPPTAPHAPEAPMKLQEQDSEKSHRLAAGMGKLEEIDLGPTSTSRAEAEWKKLQGGPQEGPVKVRLGRDGKPRRQPKRRNSEDLRRDAMVDAVLREAKLDYFDEPAPPTKSSANNEEALVEQFRQEFLESMQERQQRKPAVPARGEKEPAKGPKLGGSRSARAKMHALEESAKNKR